MRRLRPVEETLLREVLDKRRPDLVGELKRLGVVPLSVEERETLRAAVADELVATGLRDDDEPNQRGLKLEDLIDRLGHL